MFCRNFLGLICVCVSFNLGLQCILNDYWLSDFGSDLYHEGIWQRCINNVCNKNTGRGYIVATACFLVLSTFVLPLGMLFSCFAFSNTHIGRITSSLAACIVESFSVVLLLIGMSVYTVETVNVQGHPFKFEWPYFLSWTSGLFTFIAAILHFLAHKGTPQTEYSSMQEGNDVNGTS